MKQTLLLAFLLLTGTYYTHAQALLYRPQNPAFGGQTFNYQWLQSSAQAQDKTKDPNALTSTGARSSFSSTSSLDNFSETLSRQLLSRISSQLLSSQFGEETLTPGTYQYGDLRVDITNAADGINIRIVDGQGGETTVTVPYF
ncbi:curli production assembly/transport component CsgF [Arundinibacter roseus]|uniref:Curli production assembly/transport component CsgF n=1 Tax=Arundinibacter roseus TaxID=2070510 RepID=A0A4R4K9A1_9BACT|nr:curli production assembly/transport component CsgF [Arundinibacter roseus]TDB64053.1 curli production assembly protein CsgF [Arundinibacter roseus]